jgi:hypothetical protein
MSGKDYLVYISDDGTDTGTKTLIEDQGDLTINLGKPLERTTYKDGAKTAQGNDGFSASFSMGHREPLGTGQQLVLDAVEAGGDAYCWIESATSGGVTWAGQMKVTLTEISFPVTGEPGWTIELSEDGTITRGTTT